MWDDNNITIDGAVDISDSTDQKKRFEACGWNVIKVDGHDARKVGNALRRAKKSDKPTLIACKTIIGKGAPTKGGTSKVHGAPLGDEEIAATRKALGWSHGPFEVPDDVYKMWKRPGRKGLSLIHI